MFTGYARTSNHSKKRHELSEHHGCLAMLGDTSPYLTDGTANPVHEPHRLNHRRNGFG